MFENLQQLKESFYLVILMVFNFFICLLSKNINEHICSRNHIGVQVDQKLNEKSKKFVDSSVQVQSIEIENNENLAKNESLSSQVDENKTYQKNNEFKELNNRKSLVLNIGLHSRNQNFQYQLEKNFYDKIIVRD